MLTFDTPVKRGRPVGSTYAWLDRPLYDRMQVLLDTHQVSSVRAAANVVLPDAWGYGRLRNESILDRLTEGYRRDRST
jgi:hypothetical protein